MVAVATTVSDFEPLHDILVLFKVKRQVFLNLFTRSTSLPAGVLGLGKMWAPGSGLQRGWGRRGIRRLGAGQCPCSRSFGGGVSSRSWGWAPFLVGVLVLGEGYALAFLSWGPFEVC